MKFCGVISPICINDISQMHLLTSGILTIVKIIETLPFDSCARPKAEL